MINILSALIYGWCLYTAFFDSSAYADYMGAPSEPDAEAEDTGEDDAPEAAESEESSDEAD